jgi:branched-chain amino acid transport system substrate-binding protein
MTTRRTRRCAVVGTPLVLALAMSACGSSGGGGATSAGSATTSAAAATTPSATASSPGKAAGVYAKFVGGTAGKADGSKSPITIGFLNDEGGVPSFPEGSVAANAAVQFVNDQLGGIGGHPVKLETCLVATGEEQGQACAQKFLNDSAISAVVEDSAVVGAQAFHQTMAGKKPVIIGSPNSVADATAKNAYGISPGVFGTDPGFVTYSTKYLHAKKASLLFPADDPTGQVAAKQISQSLQKAGLSVKQSGYKSTSPNFLPQVTAAGASQADVTATLFPSPPTCIAGGKAIQQAAVTKPVLSLGLCIGDPIKKALGDYPKWTYVFINENPDLPAADPYVAAYGDVMHQYAGASANLGGFAQHAFMGVLTTAKFMNEIGADTITPAAIAAKAKAFTGPTPMLPPNLKFGSVPGLPALGSIQTRLYTYEGGGKFKDATGGKWIAPGA